MNKRQKELRLRIIEMGIKTTNSHIAPALSCCDILDDIFNQLKDEDEFILSKGHSCLALYVVLQDHGYTPDIYQGHPDIDVKNRIPCCTGSLGHGLPIGIGMALAKKIKNEKGLIYVLLGDGECEEGTTWESVNLINRLGLDNMRIIVDHNRLRCLSDITEYTLPECKYIKVIDTVKGSGVSFMENEKVWHAKIPNDEEMKIIYKELK